VPSLSDTPGGRQTSRDALEQRPMSALEWTLAFLARFTATLSITFGTSAERLL